MENNCDDCIHMRCNPDGGWCYMFAEKMKNCGAFKVDAVKLNNKYPVEPGAGTTQGSKDAAACMKGKVTGLREEALFCIGASIGGLTAEEIGRILKPEKSKEVVRAWINPRISELRAMGLIKDSGITRESGSGIKITVWIRGTDHEYLRNRLASKPVGDKKLWGEYMRALYAHAHSPDIFTSQALKEAAHEWQINMTCRLRDG